MPKSALSDRLNDPENWKGTDDDNWLMRWRIYAKGWFAYGPRASEWWAKWREWPKTLFAAKGKDGYFRIETENWERDSAKDCLYDARTLLNENLFHVNSDDPHVDVISYGYLSRVQKYTRWSIQIQWPLLIAVHRYDSPTDVPKYGEQKETDGTLWFFYIGAHRDADKVYWFPSAYIGRNWK